MAKTLPYHEWLLKAIEEASYNGIRELVNMVKVVTIPIGHHDEIIDAWCKKLRRLGVVEDFDVPACVLRQKEEIEALVEARLAREQEERRRLNHPFPEDPHERM